MELVEVVRIAGSIIIFIWVSYEKPSSSYCVMLHFWGCSGNLKLITLGSDRDRSRATEYGSANVGSEQHATWNEPFSVISFSDQKSTEDIRPKVTTVNSDPQLCR